MQSGYWKFGQWKGIPFLFHWTILLWLPWSMWQYKSWSWILPSFVAYIALLFIHEMGHAIAARLTRTKVFTLKLFFMHGQCVHEEPYYESDHIWIAWGGVLAQLGILLITVSIQQMLQWLRLYIPSLLVPLFHVFIQVNFFIIIINLLPVAPLDGHVAWRILPLLWRRLRRKSRNVLKHTGNALKKLPDTKAHQSREQESKRIADDLFDRLRK